MILAQAPSRIDFSGGFTDVQPFSNDHRAVHVNAAVDLWVRLGIEARADNCIHLNLINARTAFRINRTDYPQSHYDLRLIQAAMRYFAINTGLDVIIHSEAPIGIGLGTSGATAVALVGALSALQGKSKLSPEEIAEIAFNLEQSTGALGGRQDEYAAVFGGFSQFNFFPELRYRRPLRLGPWTVKAVESHLVVAHPGGHRHSSDLVSSVLGAYELGDTNVIGALLALNSLAKNIVATLETGTTDQLAYLLRDIRYHQCRLHPNIMDERTARLVVELATIGVHGVKVLGGGGSGSGLLVCAHKSPRRAKKMLVENGCRLVPVRFAHTGLRVSRVAKFPVPFNFTELERATDEY